jgi:hypothetical protein
MPQCVYLEGLISSYIINTNFIIHAQLLYINLFGNPICRQELASTKPVDKRATGEIRRT